MIHQLPADEGRRTLSFFINHHLKSLRQGQRDNLCNLIVNAVSPRSPSYYSLVSAAPLSWL
jgi:hypothetical protein